MPTSSRRQDLVLGLVVLALVALLLFSVAFIYPRLRGDTRSLTIQFEHAAGVAPLKPGSAVMLSGAIQVGQVEQVTYELERQPDGRQDLVILVSVEVARELKLYEDCQITTDQPPVGGGGVVTILNIGTPGRAELAAGARVHGLPAQSFAAAIGGLSRRLLGPEGIVDKLDHILDAEREDSLLYKVSQSFDDINAVTASLRVQLDDSQERTLIRKIQRILDDFAATTAAIRRQMDADDQATLLAKVHLALDTLQEGLGEAAALLGDNRPAIQETVRSVQGLSKTLEMELGEALRAELNRDDPGSLLGKIHLSMDQLNGSLASLQQIMAAGRGTIVTQRPAIERTIENAKAMSEQLKLASDEIRVAPWRLLYRPGPQETQEMSVFEAARTFAEAATYLDDAAARLEAVLAAGQAAEGEQAQAEVREVLRSLQEAFQRFQRAEDYLWESMK